MTLLVSFVRGIGSVPSLLPRVRIGSIAWVMSGPTVILHPHQSKQNQRLVHLRERTSITGKLVPDNPRGEGVRGSASLNAISHAPAARLTRSGGYFAIATSKTSSKRNARRLVRSWTLNVAQCPGVPHMAFRSACPPPSMSSARFGRLWELYCVSRPALFLRAATISRRTRAEPCNSRKPDGPGRGRTNPTPATGNTSARL